VLGADAAQGGATPLFGAAESGDVAVVRALLAAKAAPGTVRHDNGGSPVHCAAQGGHIDCLRVLLSVGDLSHPTSLVFRTLPLPPVAFNLSRLSHPTSLVFRTLPLSPFHELPRPDTWCEDGFDAVLCRLWSIALILCSGICGINAMLYECAINAVLVVCVVCVACVACVACVNV
jgi:hypothetical protein